MNITRLSIKRPVGITMIVLFFVVLGIYSYYHIGVELLPALNSPNIMVRVDYPGASADSVEQEVVKPLEDALSSVSGVTKMVSTADYGRGQVGLELDFSANADTAVIDATKKVEAIRKNLPTDADSPVVLKKDLNDTPIVSIAVTSKLPISTIYSRVYNDFQNSIQQANGVSSIDLNGGRDKEVAVEVDKNKMAVYQVSLADIVSAIKSENELMPAGTVSTEKTNSDVRVLAQYASAKDIEKVMVKSASGAQVPITAIATIREQDAKINRYGRVNGQDAVTLDVYKNSDANIVQTAQNIVDNVNKLQKDNPDYTFTIVKNDADYVTTSLHNTLGTLIEGLFTTGMVLFLFLRGWRSTAAVMVVIPTSLISTFFVMYIMGFTFNMMSLMGMTLCIGILVDDSIVVLENITRHMAMGEQVEAAAEKGRTEIGMAAVAITLCDAAVFIPIAFMNGMTGQFFRQFGLTIVFAGMISLLISFTLTPMLISQLFKHGYHVPRTALWNFMDKIETGAVYYYERILLWTLDNQKKVLLSALAIFIAVISFIPLGLISSEYMPKTDEGNFQINVNLPVNKNVDETNAVMLQVEQTLDTIPEVKYYMSNTGGTSKAYQGKITVQLVDRKDRNRTIWQITDELRKDTAKIGKEQGAKISIAEAQSSVAGVSGGAGSNGAGKGSLQIELRGTDNNTLNEASQKVQTILSQDIQGISGVSSSYTEGMPEMQLTVDRDKLKVYGISLSDVDGAFASAISGKQAGTLANDSNNGGQDTDINVRFQNADNFKASDILSVPIDTNGKFLQLGSVANLTYGTGPITIRRIDKQRAIQIGANVSSGYALNDVVQQVQTRLASENLGDGITYRFSGQTTQMNDTFSELLSALFLALILIYMLLAVLYESTITPFIRMFSLPLGLIGSILLLFITHNTLNLYSMIGILVMDGIVAKNGTLLLDYTLTLMDRGETAYEAIIEAGKTRLKPIFMTTLTMIIGMLPTALSITEGAETRASMAWVIIGGLLTSTVFTLLIIPIIFLFFEKYPPAFYYHWLKRKLGAK